MRGRRVTRKSILCKPARRQGRSAMAIVTSTRESTLGSSARCAERKGRASTEDQLGYGSLTDAMSAIHSSRIRGRILEAYRRRREDGIHEREAM